MLKHNLQITDNITSDLIKFKKELEQLPAEALAVFKKSTPIDTGHARRNTRLRGDTIEADYPYARALENGHSRQAPNGMTRPTEDFIERRVDTILRKR